MSEQMTPQQVVAFLNDYFSEMVDAVFEQNGVLDKFLGDGLMAVFGSFGDAAGPSAARRAGGPPHEGAAGEDQRRARHGRTARPIAIGIGIHTDEVIVGNIGSRKRLEYTVVGDGVNTSSRLQTLNKEFGTTILISETTYARDEGRVRVPHDARGAAARQDQGAAASTRSSAWASPRSPPAERAPPPRRPFLPLVLTSEAVDPHAITCPRTGHGTGAPRRVRSRHRGRRHDRAPRTDRPPQSRAERVRRPSARRGHGRSASAGRAGGRRPGARAARRAAGHRQERDRSHGPALRNGQPVAPGHRRGARRGGRRADARGRRHRARHDQRRRHADGLRVGESAARTHAQPVGSGAHAGRIERRRVGGDRGRLLGGRHRERRRRLDSRAGALRGHLRPQADARPHPRHGTSAALLRALLAHRRRRADGANRARRLPALLRDRRLG